MKQKKTEALKQKKKLAQGFISILDTFENTRGWKYSINSFCGQKNNHKNCWCCICILLYFRKYQELRWAPVLIFFLLQCFRFFLFHYFFQPEGPRLFMWKDVVKLNMACFNSRISFPWQVGKKNEGKRSSIWFSALN